ncbi:MAG: hypothetical protein MHM6MM_006270 [Cercozoa sp. M6MM]
MSDTVGNSVSRAALLPSTAPRESTWRKLRRQLCPFWRGFAWTKQRKASKRKELKDALPNGEISIERRFDLDNLAAHFPNDTVAQLDATLRKHLPARWSQQSREARRDRERMQSELTSIEMTREAHGAKAEAEEEAREAGEAKEESWRAEETAKAAMDERERKTLLTSPWRLLLFALRTCKRLYAMAMLLGICSAIGRIIVVPLFVMWMRGLLQDFANERNPTKPPPSVAKIALLLSLAVVAKITQTGMQALSRQLALNASLRMRNALNYVIVEKLLSLRSSEQVFGTDDESNLTPSGVLTLMTNDVHQTSVFATVLCVLILATVAALASASGALRRRVLRATEKRLSLLRLTLEHLHEVKALSWEKRMLSLMQLARVKEVRWLAVASTLRALQSALCFGFPVLTAVAVAAFHMRMVGSDAFAGEKDELEAHVPSEYAALTASASTGVPPDKVSVAVSLLAVFGVIAVDVMTMPQFALQVSAAVVAAKRVLNFLRHERPNRERLEASEEALIDEKLKLQPGTLK